MFDASNDLEIYYQKGLFGEDVAYVQIGTRVFAVPHWLWAEWELPGGVQGIVDTWQGGLLKRYWPPGVIRMIEMGVAAPDVEAEVFDNLRITARAMRRLLAGKYHDKLTPLEQEVLVLEKMYIQSAPGLAKKFSKYEWISAKMSRGLDYYTPQQVRALLDDASAALRTIYRGELAEKLEKLKRAVREIKVELQEQAVSKLAA